MIEIRALSAKEMEGVPIFESSYRSTAQLAVEMSGTEPEITWSLSARELARPLLRRLDGGSLEALSDLYGPLDRLHFIGAFDSDRLTGLVTWRFEAWNEAAWLCDIRVRPNAQRKGVGSRLLDELMWAAARLDARGIMLETQTSNIPAIAFYLGHGFQVVGLNSAMYGPPGGRGTETALFFWLPLAG